MSIAKPFTFTANTYAKASEVNADFDIVYSQVNTNISDIAQNATDIDNLENNKANINGNTSQRFAVADAVTNGDAINKQTLFKAIGNTLDYISGLAISKDNGSPDDTIIVSAGSAYDSTKSIVLSLANSLSKQNTNQAANATYYVYIIGSSSGSQTDILISPNQVTPTLPTGYSLYRQIGYYTTDSNNKINGISYYGESTTTDKSSSGVLNIVAPDWSNKTAKAVSTNYTADKNGFLVAYTYKDTTNFELYCYINGVLQYQGYNHGQAAGENPVSLFFPIAKGDVYNVTTTNGHISQYYFVPVKGGN